MYGCSAVASVVDVVVIIIAVLLQIAMDMGYKYCLQTNCHYGGIKRKVGYVDRCTNYAIIRTMQHVTCHGVQFVSKQYEYVGIRIFVMHLAKVMISKHTRTRHTSKSHQHHKY